ncbi:MAG: glycoside hydrolase family 30 beta sandwich domain-containing protein [Myxococcota bacterium]
MQAHVTAASGERLARLPVRPVTEGPADIRVSVDPHARRQTVVGIGGSLTQASAAALRTLSDARQAEILEAMFSPSRAAYSLVRTHVASCDFSTSSYTYAPDPDPSLAGFSIENDRDNGHLALLKAAQAVPGSDFRIVASPWTAPPWMKDNGKLFDPSTRRGGALLETHHETFSRYLARYVEAYRAEGLDIWALTPVNEPHGNQGTWESMEMSPEQQRALVKVMRRTLAARDLDVQILCYDQNRKGVEDYARGVLSDEEARSAVDGIAVHWYDSTFKVYGDVLDRVAAAHPDHPVIQTEGCIDNVFGLGKDRSENAPLPWWQDDGWFWRKEATDWGWDWLDDKSEHPPYAPTFRYARDLVGCLAHHVAGWIDWNVVLDQRGGPNHVGNFCLAPILVDGATDTVHYTPLFAILEQVSRSTRPGAHVFETTLHVPPEVGRNLRATGLVNPDGTHVVHLFHEGDTPVDCRVEHGVLRGALTVPPASIVTLRSQSLE